MIHLTLIAAAVLQVESEPARVLTLTVNDVEYTIEEGQEFQLPHDLNQPRIKVTPTGQRQFKYAGMRFRYPDELSFQTDHELGVRNWTIDGWDTELDVYTIPLDARSYLQHFVDSMVSLSEIKDQTPELKVGNIELRGRQLTTWECSIALGPDQSYDFWVLELPVVAGEVRLLMFDLEYSNGRLTAQTVKLKNMVLDSLQF